jgi:hypothetical protein
MIRKGQYVKEHYDNLVCIQYAQNCVFCCGLVQFCKSTTKEPFHRNYVISNHSCAHPTHESKKEKSFLDYLIVYKILYYDDILFGKRFKTSFQILRILSPSFFHTQSFGYSTTRLLIIFLQYLSILAFLMNDFHTIGFFYN